ncbi:alkaline-phosphatase-like protein [Scenedesmus sp. NREL 46B-D3]|nr:alkaline-phosphatase-like protein [Scenedesmus sp. NREL 46B-D3]
MSAPAAPSSLMPLPQQLKAFPAAATLAGVAAMAAAHAVAAAAAAAVHLKGSTKSTIAKVTPSGMAIKPLADGSKPNFIIILTDDQGYDDIGLHNPSYVKTPNLDRFMRRALRFDNFYVTPQCAQSRAALLTGRSSARVGYDFINSAEATAAEVMSAAGYDSVHYGKWHNGRTLGYEPWHVGFSDSWFPPMASEDAFVSHNGTYVQTKKYLDEMLADNVLGYLNAQQNSTKPFYMYYAPHAIHTSRTDGPFKGSAFRLFPQRYRADFKKPRYQSVTDSTIDAWAMVQYLDDVLGRLFSFLESSPLGKNTYVMVMSDNGPQLLNDEKNQQKMRIPSKMQGAKSLANEAGIRNFLAVSGPGVPGGIIDSSLLDLTDILPTMADLAGVPEGTAGHKPWEGMSFKNLLNAGNSSTAVAAAGVQLSGRRGTAMANAEQSNRFVFALSAHCWDADAVPALGPDREVLRPQPLLNYDNGGVANSVYWKLLPGLRQTNPGFEACIAVRHREYKWLGATGKVYRFQNESHVELPCNEVPEPQASAMAHVLSSAARAWWTSLAADTSSFTKPTYYLGMGTWRVTNMLADGAHERTPGNITLLANGAAGFRAVGDRMCFRAKVFAAGSYDATMFYTSKQWAVFKLSFGSFKAIQAGTAPSISTTLPAVGSVMRGQMIGNVQLQPSGDEVTEACLELIDSEVRGAPVFKHLANIRITRRAAPGEVLADDPGPGVDPVRATGAVTAAAAASRKAGSTKAGSTKAGSGKPSATGSSTTKQSTNNNKPSGNSRPRHGSSSTHTHTTATGGSLAGNNGAAAAAVDQGSSKAPATALPRRAASNLGASAAAGSLPSSSASGLRTAAPGADLSGSSSGSSSTDDDTIAVPKGRRSRPAPVALATTASTSLPPPAVEHWVSRGPAVEHWVPTGPAAAAADDAASAAPPPGLDTHNAPVATPAPTLEALPLLQPGQNPIGNFFATLRSKYKWPEGQGLLESMFSPFDAEDIDMCEACKPEV